MPNKIQNSNDRIKKCKVGCECKDTGFIEINNFGLFCSEAKTIPVVCSGPMGDAINKGRSPAKRSPVYDPETMILAGEVAQRQFILKPGEKFQGMETYI